MYIGFLSSSTFHMLNRICWRSIIVVIFIFSGLFASKSLENVPSLFQQVPQPGPTLKQNRGKFKFKPPTRELLAL